MASLLFIDHIYHKTTQSTSFLIDILKSKYEITLFYIDPSTSEKNIFRAFKGKFYDIVVCFQIFPPRQELDKNVEYRFGALFPMFDAIPPLHSGRWYEYYDFQIINFCKLLHEQLTKIGFSSKYIQYFPKPYKISDLGDESSAFFWQRGHDITLVQVEKLLSQSEVERIHLHNVPDPGYKLTMPSQKTKKITQSAWYPEKASLLKKIEKSSLYIAPRLQEGIGMSFLEAMAMGRCVIAPNMPTMNEYIIQEKTGILYQYENLNINYIKNIREIQKKTITFIQYGYQNWEKEKFKILDWLTGPIVYDKSKLSLFYSFYRKRFFLLGVQLAESLIKPSSWEYYVPAKNYSLLSVQNNKKSIKIKFFGIPVVSVKKNIQ